MSNTAERTCKTCCFFGPDEYARYPVRNPDAGNCRRFPEWVAQHASNVCGEWRKSWPDWNKEITVNATGPLVTK